MGPSSSWTPLSNLRIMAHCPSLCTGNLHTLTSTCSGIVTITSLPNLVSSTPSPIWPKQCAASLSGSNRKRTTSGRLLPNANILNGLWTRWRRLNRSIREVIDGVNNQGTTAAQAATNAVKTKGHIVIPYIQGLCESIKRSVVDIAFKPTLKVAGPSRTSWSPQGQRPYGQPKWCHILVPVW